MADMIDIDTVFITHNGAYYKSSFEPGMKISTSIDYEPGKMVFSLDRTANNIVFTEGDEVKFLPCRFYGKIYEITDNSDNNSVEYTCYDQIRTLKSKDTYVFDNPSTSGGAENAFYKICEDYKINKVNFGFIKTTSTFRAVWENMELIDMMKGIADFVLKNTGKRLILMDDKGELMFRPVGQADGQLVRSGVIVSMRPPVTITLEKVQSYTYTSSIENTFNQVKVFYDNDNTGKREVYVAKDSNNIFKWGLLSTTETMQRGENGRTKADTLLRLYNHKTRRLELNILTDGSLRAGQLVRVKMKVRDMNLDNYFLISKCEHSIEENAILTRLTLIGGEFGD